MVVFEYTYTGFYRHDPERRPCKFCDPSGRYWS